MAEINTPREDQTIIRACQKIATGLLIRYGTPLFTRIHGDKDAFAKSFARVLEGADISAETAFHLCAWLRQGLRSFSEYPPQIEILLQLAYLVEAYPLTDYQSGMKATWYALDTTYAQTYHKAWRSDKALDETTRERVWLSAFESLMATPEEIMAVKAEIQESGAFRQYPPTLEQFRDALLAIRLGAPIVEVAWLQSTRASANDHRLVIQARSLIGSHDLNVHARDRDTEGRFKSIYRRLLSGKSTFTEQVIQITDETPVVEYQSKESLAELVKTWG